MIAKSVSGSASIVIKETDGSPSVTGVKELRFPSGSVTDLGAGVVQVSISGGGIDGGLFTDVYQMTGVDGGAFV